MPNRVIKRCKQCECILDLIPSKIKRTKFCSYTCSNISKRGAGNPMFGKIPWNKNKKTKKETIDKWKNSVKDSKWGKYGFKNGNKTKSQFKK